MLYQSIQYYLRGCFKYTTPPVKCDNKNLFTRITLFISSIACSEIEQQTLLAAGISRVDTIWVSYQVKISNNPN